MRERDQFGPGLRREREKRGISLQEIATRTKISASFFEALERNDFSRWPGGIFRRSFLRSYAESVGVDADAVVRDCARLFPCEDEQADGDAASRAKSGTSEDRASHAANRAPRSTGTGAGVWRMCLVAAATATAGALAWGVGGPYAWLAAGSTACAAVVSFVLLARKHRRAQPAVETAARSAERPVATVVRINHAPPARQAAASHHIAKRRGQRDRLAPPPQRRRGKRGRPRA